MNVSFIYFFYILHLVIIKILSKIYDIFSFLFRPIKDLANGPSSPNEEAMDSSPVELIKPAENHDPNEPSNNDHLKTVEHEDNSTLDLSMSSSNNNNDKDSPPTPPSHTDSIMTSNNISHVASDEPNSLVASVAAYHALASERGHHDHLSFDKSHPRIDHDNIERVNVIHEDDNEQTLDLSKSSVIHSEDESVDLSKPKISYDSDPKDLRANDHSIHSIANIDKDTSREVYDDGMEGREVEEDDEVGHGQPIVARYSPALPMTHGHPGHSPIHPGHPSHIPYSNADEDDLEPPQHPIKCPIPRPAGLMPPAGFESLPHSLHRSPPPPSDPHDRVTPPPPPPRHYNQSPPPHGLPSSMVGSHGLAHHPLHPHRHLMDGSPSQGSEGSTGLNQSPAHPLNLHQSPAHPPPVSSPVGSDNTSSFHPTGSSSTPSGYLSSSHGGGLGDTGGADSPSASAAAHLAAAGLPYSMSSQYTSSPYNHHYFSNATSYGQNYLSSHGFPPTPHSFAAVSQAAAEMRSMMGASSHEMYMGSQGSGRGSMHDSSSNSVASSLKEFSHHPGLLGGLANHHSPRQVTYYLRISFDFIVAMLLYRFTNKIPCFLFL